MDELGYNLNDLKVFLKFNLNKLYDLFSLDENNWQITTFSTHNGLARYCRLNFEIYFSEEIFHEEFHKKNSIVPGEINIHFMRLS